MAAEIGDRVLEGGIDAAYQRPAIDFSRREHRLAEDVRRRGLNVWIPPRGLRERMPVGDAAREAAYLDVRGDRQDARAQLLLEAVHHRQYDDERGDTQGDAQHRHRGDERHKPVTAGTAARAGIAQSDE